MANRFSQWAPTGPVQLPIETYQAAGIYNDNKVRKDLEDIQSTLGVYNSITPFGANATALYTETMDQMRTNAQSLAKMNLSTPEAKRKINEVLGDRKTVGTLKAIQQDAMAAVTKQKELNEYLKKNPTTNTYEYSRMFNNINAETGDSSKFEANRFQKLGPLVEYTDTYKMIEEGIAKLKADEVSVKKIMGDYYHEYKEKGLHQNRIREHVMNNLKNNPLVNEQVNRNLEATIHRIDPMSREGGFQRLAESYRNEFETLGAQDISRLAAKLNGKSKTQIDKDPKLSDARTQLDQAVKMLERYRKLSPEELVSSTFANSFIKGFDDHAYSERHEGWSYTEMARARFDWSNRWGMHNDKMKRLEAALAPPAVADPTYQALPLTQAEVTDANLPTQLKGIPGLEGVHELVGSNGSFTEKNANVNGNNVYSPSNLASTGMGSGTVPFMNTNRSAAPLTKNQAVEKIKTKLKAMGVGAYRYNNLNDEVSIRKALVDIAKFHVATDQSYMNSYTVAQGDGEYFRKEAISSIGRQGLYNSDGEKVDSDVAIDAQQYIADNKMLLMDITPALRNKELKDQSFMTFTYKGKVYHTPVNTPYNNKLAAARYATRQGFDNKTGVVVAGARGNESLNVIEMHQDGRMYGLSIPGAGTSVYQNQAKQQWAYNLQQLTSQGLSVDKATEILNNEYEAAKQTIATTGRPALITFNLKGQQKSATISVPMKERQGMYYSEFPLFQDQRPATGIREFVGQQVKSFSNPNEHPAIFNASQGLLRAKTKETMLLQSSLLDDDDD